MSLTHFLPVPVICLGVFFILAIGNENPRPPNSTLVYHQPSRHLATGIPLFLLSWCLLLATRPLLPRYQVTNFPFSSSVSTQPSRVALLGNVCGTGLKLGRLGRNAEPSLPGVPPATQFQEVLATSWSYRFLPAALLATDITRAGIFGCVK